MRKGTKICVGVWLQCFFTLIVVDYVHFASPYDNVYKCNCVGYVLFIIPVINSSFNQAPTDEAGDDLDGIFTTEAPEFINLSTIQELNADHVIYGLVGTFYLSID